MGEASTTAGAGDLFPNPLAVERREDLKPLRWRRLAPSAKGEPIPRAALCAPASGCGAGEASDA